MERTVTPREADFTSYHSYRFPEEFDISWPDFYREADAQAAHVRETVRNDRHILYGSDAFQLLNIFLPSSPTDAPIFLFAHGGGFREGHPDHYDSLAPAFVENGAIFVTYGYRLRPQAGVPEAIDDGAHAVAWMFHHAEDYGGNPRRLFVGGHSAGAMISASLAVRDDWQAALGLPTDVIRGAALISGGYDWRRLNISGPETARLDPSENLRRLPERFVIAFGPAEKNRHGSDPALLANSSRDFAQQIERAGGTVEVVPVEGADHHDTARMLGQKGSPVLEAVKRLIWPD